MTATGHDLHRLLDGGLVWDNHACMPLDHHDLGRMDDLYRCRDAGVDIVSINVASGDQAPIDAIRMLAAFRRWIAGHGADFTLVGTADDAMTVRSQGKLGVCFDIEGMTVLDGNIDLIALFHDLGVRWMLTAYNYANAVGSGCLDLHDQGLTAYGRAVVTEMNRVGMVVCGSHAGDRTARDLIDASSQPVIFSHSNPRAVHDCLRNIPDDVMVACARRGGVIGLNGIGAFVGANDDRTDTFIRHIEYAIDLIGEDHVGLALDYCFGSERGMQDFTAEYPVLFPQDQGYDSGLKMIAPWRLAEIAQALAARGFGQATLAKLFGANHLRIARTVWR